MGLPAVVDIWKGSIFNWENYSRYSAKEVSVRVYEVDKTGAIDLTKWKSIRVDSYTPGEEVVSRKFTQFADVSEQTAKASIRDSARYAPNKSNIRIARTKGNVGKLEESYLDSPLRGELIMEVPPQRAPVPESILKDAAAKKVKIRDTDGVVYDLDHPWGHSSP